MNKSVQVGMIAMDESGSIYKVVSDLGKEFLVDKICDAEMERFLEREGYLKLGKESLVPVSMEHIESKRAEFLRRVDRVIYAYMSQPCD